MLWREKQNRFKNAIGRYQVMWLKFSPVEGIYPEIWEEDDALSEVVDSYERIREFFKMEALAGNAVVTFNIDFHHANLLRRLLSAFDQKVNRGNKSDQVDDAQACIFKSKGLEIKLFVKRHAENNRNNCPDWIHLNA